MDDLIKRSDAIKAILQKPAIHGSEGSWYHADDIRDALNAVPSADRPQGEWIDEGRNLWGCSNCGMEIYSESERDRNEFHKWCSRCGARMKGADDEV